MYEAVELVRGEEPPSATQAGKPQLSPYSLMDGLRRFASLISHHSYPLS